MRRALLAGVVIWNVFGLVVAAALARADDIRFENGVSLAEPNSPDKPMGPCKRPDSTPKATDPVELDSGAPYLNPGDLTSPDLLIPVRGHTIDLRRAYRYHYAYNGPLGVGWDFPMNRRLRQLDNGNVVLTSGLCRSDEFVFNGSGWATPDGSTSTLVQNPDGSYTETFRSGLEHHFDANGSLVQVRDRHGNAIQLTYSPQKMPIQGISEFFVDTTPRVVTLEYRLLTITDPTGRQIQFGYEPNGRIQTVTDWIGRIWSYGYDARGNLASVTSPGTTDFPAGTSTTYKYDDTRYPNAITKIIAPNQQGSQVARLTNVYDTQGRVFRQDLGDGGVIYLSYDPNGLTTVTDANGTQKVYQLGDRQLIAETVITHGVRPGEAVGTLYSTTYQFTKEQRTRTVFPEGNAVEYVYDPNNPDPHARGNLLQIRRLPKPGSSEPPLITTFTYKTPYQQIGTVTDPRGKVTEFFYDAANNLQRIQFPTVPEGTPQQLFSVNALGQVETMTDENGHVTRFVYDANGYLDQVTCAYGTARAATTELDPDAVGRPSVVRDPRGNTTALVYNSWDKLETSVAPPPFGYVTQMHYDADGNLAQIDRQSELAGNPQTTQLGYTIFDQLQTITNELGETTTFGHDLNHNRNLVRDAELNATTTVFDERNLPYQTTDAESRVTKLNYQPNGTLAQVIDGNGHATGYASDDFDRLKTITHADATTEQFLYDPAGNLFRKTTRAGQQINFSYDDRNRLRSRASPTETATFTYNLAGQMSHAQNSAATLDFGYDERDELTSETTNIPGLATQIVGHEYDPAGNRTKLTYPDGAYVSYVYDELNRLKILRDDQAVDQVTYSYDELSRISHMLRASGVTSDYTYDRASRVLSITHASPSAGVLEGLVYHYNPSGTIHDMADHNGLHIFGYDKTYQLTSVDYPSASPFPDIEYHYDNAGNRTSTATPSGSIAYSSNALNEYSLIGGVAQTYDTNGNLTSDGTSGFSFDAENRLISATTSTGTTAYSYDPFMRRTRTALAGVNTFMLWGENDELAEYRATGERRVLYVRDGSFAPIQATYGVGASEARHDILIDDLGSPLLATNSSAATSWRVSREAFGAVSVDAASTIEFNLRLPGQVSDVETGLHYNRFRSYDPHRGGYLSPDPLGQTAGVRSYTYVANSPLQHTDPSGLFAITGATSVATAAASGAGGVAAVAGAVVVGFGIGYGIGTGINYYAEDWIQDQLQAALGPQDQSDSDLPMLDQDVDPVSSDRVDPGHCPSGDGCNPCPPNQYWRAPGNAHGSTSGYHVHGIVWNQIPYPNCTCVPRRVSGPTLSGVR